MGKEDLEQQKLLLEIRELKKPWYKKPGWWAIIITLGSLIYGISTGYFSNQLLLLEIKKVELRNEVKDIESRKDSLEKWVAKVREDSTITSDHLKKLQKDSIMLSSKINVLSDSVLNLQNKIKPLETQVESLKNYVAFNPLTFHLNIIKRAGEFVRYSDVSTEYFINYLREQMNNPSFVKILEDSISTFKIVKQRALLYHILYASTKKIKYMDSLVTAINWILPISSTFSPLYYYSLKDILGNQINMTVNDKVKICSALIKYLEKVEWGKYNLYFICDVYRIVLEYDKDIWNKLDRNHKSLINLIIKGRDILLTEGLLDDRIDLYKIFSEFIPIPFIVFTSKVMVDSVSYFPATNIHSVMDYFKASQKAACKNLDIPNDYDVNSWINWRKRASVLIKTWMGNLDALSTDEETFNYYFYNYKLPQ